MPIEIIKYDTVKAALKKDKPEPKMTLKKVFHIPFLIKKGTKK
jgi:hypothetical protein